jgi:glutathione S-transferase
MILYHFPTSPYARRVRLALAHKGLEAELRDARADASHREEMQRLNPMQTVPVLVDGERVIADSSAICQYLERKVPEPPLWPAGLDGVVAFELAALSNGIIDTFANVGMRYHSLSGDPGFPGIQRLMVGRAQRSLDLLAGKADSAKTAGGTFARTGWSMADIVVFTLVTWLEGLPVRAATYEPARQVVSLGWTLPRALGAWADAHRQRADVRALG